MNSVAKGWLLNKRCKVNRNIDRTELDIMYLMREGLDPTDLIMYRESLRSRAYGIHKQLIELV